MSMKILSPPLADDIRELCSSATDELVIITPWLKQEAFHYLTKARGSRRPRWRVLTAGALNDFATGSSDISVIETLLKWGAEVRLVSNLHAKLYLADRQRAIITSANLTYGGLQGNLELGVLTDDPHEVRRLYGLADKWFKGAKLVDAEWVSSVKTAIRSPSDAMRFRARADEEVDRLENKFPRPRLHLPKPKEPVRKGQERRRKLRVTGGPIDWKKSIRDWRRIKRTPELAPLFVRFFELAFYAVAPALREQALFGVRDHAISLVIGHLYLAAVCVSPRRVWLLLDRKFDLPYATCRLAKSTKRYSPLYWMEIESWRAVSDLIQQDQVWDSLGEASEKVLTSPFSRMWDRRIVANKSPLADILAAEAEGGASPSVDCS